MIHPFIAMYLFFQFNRDLENCEIVSVVPVMTPWMSLHWLEAPPTAYCAVMFYSLLNKKRIATVKCIWEQACVVFFLVFFELEFFFCLLFSLLLWELVSESNRNTTSLQILVSNLSPFRALGWQIRGLNSTIWSYFRPCVISIHSEPHGTRLSVWESIWAIN